MSVSPAQNFSKPPLVPDAPTLVSTPEFSSLKSSPAASANGCTVLEPSIEMSPERSPPPELSSSSPHAAIPRPSAPVVARARSHLLPEFTNSPFRRLSLYRFGAGHLAQGGPSLTQARSERAGACYEPVADL